MKIEKLDLPNSAIEFLQSQGFQKLYKEYASGLFTMNSTGVVTPGHPLYTRQNSVETLQTENDKLLKENLELKKKLEKESKSK